MIDQQFGAKSMERQQVLSELLKDYDPMVYPNDQDGTQTVATVQLTISDVFQTNDRTEELEMTFYLRMAWNDPRLHFENETNITFTSIELTGDKANKLWMPDLFFYDERKASSHGVIGQEKLIYIYKDGNISFSERISMTTECIMNFEKFPFDTQKCILHMESYAYTTQSLVLKWASRNEAVQNEDPNTPYFKITNIDINSGIHTWSSFSIYSEARNFSYLNAILTLERRSAAYGFMFFGTYPFYVSLAFFSFGFKDATPRFTIVSTAAAGIAIQWIAVYATLPPTAHFTVLDRWITVHMCIIWIVIIYNVLFHIWTQMNECADVGTNKVTTATGNDGRPDDHQNSNDNSGVSRSESKWNFNAGQYGAKRSFSEVYYLQTYLQAVYPDFKWPDPPVQNVLTSREEMHFNEKREEYIRHMEKLLKPDFWKEHTKIQKVIETFCKDGMETSKKIYIVFFVDTAGRYTAPDLLVFIILLITYSLFIPCVLKYVSNWSWWSLGVAIFISMISCCIKYKKMKPPELWDTTKQHKVNDVEMEQPNEKTHLIKGGEPAL